MYGQSGSSVLNLKNGTFTNNQARLVHVSGGGTHTINIENATFTNNSVKGCGAIFLMDQSNAATPLQSTSMVARSRTMPAC